jgi:hypothetical protein
MGIAGQMKEFLGLKNPQLFQANLQTLYFWYFRLLFVCLKTQTLSRYFQKSRFFIVFDKCLCLTVSMSAAGLGEGEKESYAVRLLLIKNSVYCRLFNFTSSITFDKDDN